MYFDSYKSTEWQWKEKSKNYIQLDQLNYIQLDQLNYIQLDQLNYIQLDQLKKIKTKARL